MGHSHWIDAKDRKAAADRPDWQGTPHLMPQGARGRVASHCDLLSRASLIVPEASVLERPPYRHCWGISGLVMLNLNFVGPDPWRVPVLVAGSDLRLARPR
jgi:hypothetical protein